MAKITGVGGIILLANDPVKLARWYGGVVGIATEYNAEDGSYYGMLKDIDTGTEVPFGISQAKEPIPPGPRGVMVNYRVDDMKGFLGVLASKDVTPDRTEESEYGKFAWITDPEGNPLEIWSPN